MNKVPEILPCSAVVATRHRADALEAFLRTLAAQEAQPRELILVDASNDTATRELAERWQAEEALHSEVRWMAAETPGAAVQRNQGVREARENVIWFADDDILLREHALVRLWEALHSDGAVGGAGALIENQQYHRPGRPSRMLWALFEGKRRESYAGRILGPAVNLWPEDDERLPEVMPVDWLATTCTLYRREALPKPPFAPIFTGYSLMEDVALSLVVARKCKLVTARTGRIFHDSRPGAWKDSPRELARMDLVNRHFVMTEILHRRGFLPHVQLLLYELFIFTAFLSRADTRPLLGAHLRGKWEGLREILRRPARPSS